MFRTFFALLFLSCIGLIACEGHPGIDAQLASHQIMEPNNSPALEGGSLATCDQFNPTDCPSGVALLLGGDLQTSKNPARCSSFLVGKRILITNNHCIPTEVKQDPNQCPAMVTAVFPKTPFFDGERASCERILHLSEDGLSASTDERDLPAKRPDYAVIYLDRDVNRPVFTISREGIPNNTELTVFAFDPAPHKPGHATLKRKICKSIQSTDLVPSYQDRFSPVVSFKDCSIISGNSGSVAIDSQGLVRALLHATWPLDTENEISEATTSTSSAPTTLLAPFSVMTNAACVPLPTNFPAIAPDCSRSRPVSIDYEALYASAGNLYFEEEFRLFQQENNSPFRFKKSQRFMNERTVTFPSIDCVEKDILLKSTLVTDEDKTIYLNLPLWGPSKKVGSDYRYHAVPARIATQFTTVQFDPSQLLKDEVTLAREVRSSFFTFMDNQLELRLCPTDRN